MIRTTLGLLAGLLITLGISTDSAAATRVAYVLDFEDQWTNTTGAAALLDAADFEVHTLRLDQAPPELGTADLIFLAAFASEHPEYNQWMTDHHERLHRFVEQGGVVVQMTQADQTEARPRFLGDHHDAHRTDNDLIAAYAIDRDHPLLVDVPLSRSHTITLDESSTIWESFDEYHGFHVIMAGDRIGRDAALLEGALGDGRVILCAMAFDKNRPRNPDGPDIWKAQRDAFNNAFFRNLQTYVDTVRRGNAPPVEPSLSPAERTRFQEGSWTIAVLPDTQIYSLRYPGLFLAQTAWIAQNRDRLNIRFVLHLGDIVHNNTAPEWRHARDAMELLDGVVPYALCTGNHDYGPNGSASTRETLLNEFFPFNIASAQPTFGGAMEPGKLDNTYHLFEAGGEKWIVLALEWGPRDDTIAWADAVMTEHADRRGILITHAYMNHNERRYDHHDTEHTQQWNPHNYNTPGGVNDGQELWDKLVSRHDFVMTLNGHVLGDGTGYLADANTRGATCHQVLANYQMRNLGGEGYMRLLEFRPDGSTVQMKAYSPLYDTWLLEPDHHFTMTLSPRPETGAPD